MEAELKRTERGACAGLVALGHRVDPLRQLEVVLCEAALGVRGAHHRDLVPRDGETGVMRLTNSTEPTKSSNLKTRLMALPSRSQPGSSCSRAVTSSSARSGIVTPVRIASLVPSATEMLCALGLRDSLVAVTHECDYPEGVERLPHLTRSVIPEDLSPAEIDAAVREHTGRGEALYELDEELLHEVDPELIVTQALCE